MIVWEFLRWQHFVSTRGVAVPILSQLNVKIGCSNHLFIINNQSTINNDKTTKVITMLSKTLALRSDKLRKAAKGQQCAVQVMGVCNFNPETVVLAHLPSTTHGMAYKSDDIWAVDCCSSCHDVLDG